MSVLNYVGFYLALGAIIMFIVEGLNEMYVHPEVRVGFSWRERIFLMILWPYTVYIFAKIFLGFENGEEIEEEDKL
jgi:hypothetical protein